MISTALCVLRLSIITIGLCEYLNVCQMGLGSAFGAFLDPVADKVSVSLIILVCGKHWSNSDALCPSISANN